MIIGSLGFFSFICLNSLIPSISGRSISRVTRSGSSASNGQEAIERFDQEDPDLVTLDILLPDIDGIKLLRQMKEKKPRLPIIMSTAYDYRDDFAVWASEAYIVKSSDMTELKATIKKLTERE